MALRTRLVLALVVLLGAGLLVYGVGTYRAFERAERARFDDELRDAVGVVANALDDDGPAPVGDAPGDDAATGPDGPAPEGGQGPGPARVPPGTYARLFDDGELVGEAVPGDSDVLPDLDAVDVAVEGVTTLAPDGGDDRWRVLVQGDTEGRTVVLAAPLGGVEASLRQLLAIEAVAGAALLAALAGGAWLVLGHGLRPLERMATTARSIRAGSLEQRVEAGTGGTEVDDLATAINGMLDDLEVAFHEREATEARLRRFLADASHELRTPLTSIQGFAELLRVGRDDPNVDPDTAVRRIEQEATRMRRLVEDLLTLARLDESRVVAHAPVDLVVLAADACSDAAAVEPARPITLDATGAVQVDGDEALLRQAIANLVTNVLRHTPTEAGLHVGVRHDGPSAVVTVRDRGPGLDADALAAVFERFWQADPARAGAGAGLGLSIVQAVAAEHDGTVDAANHPDGGAVFTLRLPTGRAVEGSPPDTARTAARQRGSRST